MAKILQNLAFIQRIWIQIVFIISYTLLCNLLQWSHHHHHHSHVYGFNVDYQYPIVFSLPGRQGFGDETYFGLSLDVHKFNNRTSVIIGAPNARSSFLQIRPGRPRGTRKPTGTAFQCPLRSSLDTAVPKCEEINFHKGVASAEPRSTRGYITHNPINLAMEQMALGARVISRKGHDEALVCAPTFTEEVHQNTINHDYYPVGQCYIYNTTGKHIIKMLYPASALTRQVELKMGIPVHYYSHAESGFSAQYSPDSDRLYLGAPGFYNWRGTAIYYDLKMPLEHGYERVIEDYGLHNHRDLEPDFEGYVGYSISVAQFGPGIGEAVVAGAPRNGDLRGSAYILYNFNPLRQEVAIAYRAQAIKIRAPPLIQMGHYFGASVLAMDIDRDGLSELLVGAPLFGDHENGDQGLVAVYKDPTEPHRLRHHVYDRDAEQYLHGSYAPGSRFGSCLANAGDIDADGYNDVAIGAPYEDDGAGAIYIYFGTPTGLFRRNDMQRISARTHLAQHNLKGFGITISAGRDVDDNLYPDLLVGSYLSEKALLLRTRPVAELEASLKPSVNKINLDTPNCIDPDKKDITCFNLEYCLTYTTRKSYDPLTVDVVIRIDTLFQDLPLDELRGYFVDPDGTHHSDHIDRLDFRTTNPTRRDTQSPPLAYQICRNVTVNMLPSDQIKHQVFQKMQFNMTYQVLEPHGQFCPRCPLLAQRRDVIVEIPFETGCGPDNICRADFRLKVRAFEPNNPAKSLDRVTLGMNKEIALEVDVANYGENGFETGVLISFPKKQRLHIKSLDKLCTETSSRLSDDLDTSPSSSMPSFGRSGLLHCHTADGLMKTGDTHKYVTVFDTTSVIPDIHSLDFNVFVLTKSDQMESSQNKLTLSLPIDKEAAIKITGKTPMSTYIYEHAKRRTNDTVPFSIAWTITKYKSSPVKHVDIEIKVPRYTPKKRLVQISVLSYENLLGVHCEGIPEKQDASLIPIHPIPQPEFQPIPSPEMEPVMPRPSYERRKKRRRRRGTRIDDVLFEDDTHLIECDSNSLLCIPIKCTAGPFGQGTQIAQFRLNMVLNVTAVELDSSANYSGIDALIPGRATILDAQLGGSGSERESNTLVSVYFQRAPHIQTISHWVIWLAIAAGVIILIAIIFVLVNIGFFRRKEREELDKLVSERRHFAGIPDGAEDPEPASIHQLRADTPDRSDSPYGNGSRSQSPLDQSEIRPLKAV